MGVPRGCGSRSQQAGRQHGVTSPTVSHTDDRYASEKSNDISPHSRKPYEGKTICNLSIR
jgi:hypothetical protein